MKRLIHIAIATLLACAAPTAVAQSVAPAVLDLRAAINLALERSPDIELQRYNESATAGIAQSGRAPFDLVTSGAIGASRDERPLRADERAKALAAGTDQLINANTLSFGASRQLDSGIQLSGVYALTRSADNVQEAQNIPRQSSDKLTFTVRVPLQKNPGRDQLATRKATELEAAAAKRDTEQVVARSVLSVVQAYWDWASRVAAADVAQSAETRMRQLRRETEKMVAEDELPPSELNLLTAAMTERETARIGAQQRARDGRYALGRLYGMGALETETILVQSNGVAEWLKIALAEETGVCAATRVALPARFLWESYRAMLGRERVPSVSAFDKGPLTWRLMRLLPALQGESAFAPLRHFLGDGDPERRLQLAERLSDLFDQYQVYRADWLSDWADGRDQLRGARGEALALPPE
ncbi:MAG: exodeoxyribonuclease V subunit gamma, partial [Pseudomonadota bacterium]